MPYLCYGGTFPFQWKTGSRLTVAMLQFHSAVVLLTCCESAVTEGIAAFCPLSCRFVAAALCAYHIKPLNARLTQSGALAPAGAEGNTPAGKHDVDLHYTVFVMGCSARGYSLASHGVRRFLCIMRPATTVAMRQTQSTLSRFLLHAQRNWTHHNPDPDPQAPTQAPLCPCPRED
jgi:hypothetical protein